MLLISIDGMRPDYVTQADEHHLRIPPLRHIMSSGTYADGVTGDLPTVTYPSHGPFSSKADADLEGIDSMVQRLAAQELAIYPNAVIAIVSDHGFAPVEHHVNLAIPFLEAGLIQTGKSLFGTSVITSWQAEPWAAGCVAPIMLQTSPTTPRS